MKTTTLFRVVLVVAAMLVAAGCGDDDDAATVQPGAGDELPDPVCITDADEPAPEFVGLSESDAESLAAEQNLEVRVVGRDGECFAITMDLRDDRVNLELADDVVIAAAIY